MSNDTRVISIQVEGTKARQDLVKIGDALNGVSLYAGMSAKQIRAAERTIAAAATAAGRGAKSIAGLKQEVKGLKLAQTQSSHANQRLAGQLNTANKKIAEQAAVIKLQKSIITQITRANLEQAGSYDKVAAAATRAKNATQGVKAGGAGGNGASGSGTKSTGGGGGGRRGGGVKEEIDATEEALGHTNALRYQLYDVAATFGIMGAAALAAGTAVSRAGIEWDKNFANVIRTSQVTGRAVEWLKESFLELQGIVPVSSADLATIGTLGAQMGVSAANLVDFTRSTSEFSATAGISVDESATAISRLDQLLPDVAGNYERLASTILKTGVNAVATESQIVRGTNQIAAMGRIAGLTAPEVVALSSAMSSLGFSPELQRSVVTSSFSKILSATSQVTAKTEEFGNVLGITGKQFQSAWREDAVGTYTRLLETIASRGDAVTVLQGLGLASQRLTPNLLKLGQNTDVIREALGDTASGWEDNTEQARQYGIISGTVSAKLQILGQSWEALLVTLDDSDVVLKPLIVGLTGMVHFLRDIAKSPGISAMASIGTAVVVLAGVTALAGAGVAALAGGYIALVNAQAGLTALTAQNTAVTGANTGAKTANAAATGAVAGATGSATAATGANTAATTLANSKLLGFSSSFVTALPKILGYAGAIGLATAAMTGLASIIVTSPDWVQEGQKILAGVDSPKSAIDYDLKKIKDLAREAEKYRSAAALGTPIGPFYTGIGGAFASALNNPANQQNTALSDLEEQIVALETTEEKFAAVNAVSKELGVTQQELLTNIMPDLGSALGENAALMAEEAEAAELVNSAMSIWSTLFNTSDESLLKFNESLKSSAGLFLNFGDSLGTAYDKDPTNGEGIGAFQKGVAEQLTTFESFYSDLGSLVQNGGVELAGFFAQQGPVAASALADTLKLGPGDIAKLEEQMALAAFYASDAFAETFDQNNSILAQVWQQSGNDPKAVAAFNAALSQSMQGGVIDPTVLAQLAKDFGIVLDVEAVPTIDPDSLSIATALLSSTVTPISVPVDPVVREGVLIQEVDAWIVEMDGHQITLPVAPDTERGKALLAEWRANEYMTPVSLRAYAETTGADAVMAAFRKRWSTLGIKAKADTIFTKDGTLGPGAATGAMVAGNKLLRNNYPGYAKGTILRGPGSGTSDSILARVSNGEAITRARAVRHYGPRMMEDINNLRYPKFAQGRGPVAPAQSTGVSSQTPINIEVTQMYPTTRDPIKTLRDDAAAVIAGIWE